MKKVLMHDMKGQFESCYLKKKKRNYERAIPWCDGKGLGCPA